jgi:signal recognition particle receptor subunit beta
MSVYLLVIFNLSLDVRPSSSISTSSLIIFFLQQTVTPQSQHNSTAYNFFNHHNTHFVSIHVLIQILLNILHLK